MLFLLEFLGLALVCLGLLLLLGLFVATLLGFSSLLLDVQLVQLLGSDGLLLADVLVDCSFNALFHTKKLLVFLHAQVLLLLGLGRPLSSGTLAPGNLVPALSGLAVGITSTVGCLAVLGVPFAVLACSLGPLLCGSLLGAALCSPSVATCSASASTYQPLCGPTGSTLPGGLTGSGPHPVGFLLVALTTNA